RLFPHAQRYLQHTSLYRTEADALTIWRALARQSGVQPAGGLGLDGPGVTLSKIRDLGLVRYTVGVRIWPAAGRMSVMFQQTLFLLP
ncbi:MAG: hypothetical protein JNK29_00745, partial [Anaerolineales bacterium]|nr:hypothetical protein [Anaerolineales bacterium]